MNYHLIPGFFFQGISGTFTGGGLGLAICNSESSWAAFSGGGHIPFPPGNPRLQTMVFRRLLVALFM